MAARVKVVSRCRGFDASSDNAYNPLPLSRLNLMDVDRIELHAVSMERVQAGAFKNGLVRLCDLPAGAMGARGPRRLHRRIMI